MKDNQDLLAMIASRKPGETVKLEVLRGGETLKVDVKLTTRPVSFDGDGPSNEPKDDDQAVPTSGEGLGIKVQGISPLARRQLKMEADAPGVMIVGVDPESDAAEEGLAERQIITAIDDHPVKSVADWNRIIQGLKPGATAKVDIDLGQRTEIVFLTVPEPKSR